MISHKHKCIFIHIPRTGGTSIEYTIWGDPRKRKVNDLWMGLIKKHHNKYQTGALQHLLAKQIREEVGEEIFDSYWKFSFVRNPWDKIISQYHFTKRKGRLRLFLGVEKIESLEEYLNLTQKKKHVQWEEQWKFLYDEDCLVNDIYRFEDFKDSAQNIYLKLNLPSTIYHKNRTFYSYEHYSEYYTQETREIVAEMYATDIAIFNYKFKPPGEK